MVDRQEIDALLISALYGELTPADESRLEAHLEAHPTDKSALAALTSTRDAVRESRILTVQLDPPQSVSALLLQEAHRRAPKKAEGEGWFARLAKSFMAHPAMAAAAMLVVVLGVATLVNNKKGDEFAQTSAPATSNEMAPMASGSGSAAVTDQSIAAADKPTGGKADGKDGYKVDLAEGSAPDSQGNLDRKLADGDQAAVRREQQKVMQERAKAEAEKSVSKQMRSDDSGLIGGEDAPAKGKAAPAKKTAGATKGPSGAYMELRPPADPTPKDLDGVYDYEDDLAKEQVNAVTPGPSSGAGGAGSAATGYAKPPATTVTTTNTNTGAKSGEAQTKTVTPTAPRGNVAPSAPGRAPGAANGTATANNTTTPPPKNPAPVTQPTTAPKTPSPPPPPAKVAQNDRAPSPAEKPRAAAPAEDKSANDPQLAWAREQHMAIIARVRAGDCTGAAKLAVTLANRDMAYYKQNVATDRAAKSCAGAMNQYIEKDAEQRAERSRNQKRANEPAKATAVDAAQFVK